jgi:Fe-S oxidoreductase
MLERILPWLALTPRLSNFFSHNPLTRALLERAAGIVDAPRLDPEPALSRLRKHGIPVSDLAALRALPKNDKLVVILQDAFTSFYEPSVLEASCLLLRGLGFLPHVLPYFENGKALHIKGFLGQFQSVVHKNSALLRQVAALGLPMVGVEPAVVLTYRDEYPKELAEPAGFRVALLQEWLSEQTLSPGLVQNDVKFRLLSHCTEQALVSKAPAMWAKVFESLGVPLEIVKTGCCGMCGVYGHEARHLDDSLGIFELSWNKKLDSNADRERVLATGHSCRHQVERSLGFTPRHPAEALLSVLAN